MVLFNKKVIAGLVGVFVGIIQGLFVPYTVAQEKDIQLSVSPLFFDTSLSENQTWASELRITNPQEDDLTVYVSVIPLERSPQGQAFVPVIDSEIQSSRQLLASSVDLKEDSVRIPGLEHRDIEFSITAHKHLLPGSHYAGIAVNTRSFNNSVQENFSGVGVSSILVIPISVSLDGDQVLDIRVIHDVLDKKVITGGSNEVSFLLSNVGTTHVEIDGEATLSSLRNTWDSRMRIIPETKRSIVFPKEREEIVVPLETEYGFWSVDRVKVLVDLQAKGYDWGSQHEYVFWVLPPIQTIITALALFFLLVLLGVVIKVIPYRKGRKIFGRTMVVLIDVIEKLFPKAEIADSKIEDKKETPKEKKDMRGIVKKEDKD